jgi:hypothetical protein
MEQLVPKTPRDRKLQILSEAMTVAGGEARVPARQIAYAEKIVALDPENINALRTLVTVGPVAEGPAAMDAATERVMGYSRKILALRKPERISDGEWRRFRAEIQEQTHAIVFRKLMNSGDHAGCVAAFEELVMLAPTDASAQYRLGVCYLAGTSVAAERANAASLEVAAFIRECAAERSCGSPENTSRNEALLEKQEQRMQDFEKLRDKAIDALAVSVAVGGDLTEIAASRELERAWRAKNSSKDNPLDGLDALIALKKKEIGGK